MAKFITKPRFGLGSINLAAKVIDMGQDDVVQVFLSNTSLMNRATYRISKLKNCIFTPEENDICIIHMIYPVYIIYILIYF